MQATRYPSCALTQRWQRLRMHVACGLSADQPNLVRLYLGIGLKIARSGALPAASVHLRMLQTLLQAAQDEGLPWHWRSVCLEHATLPLAWLGPLLAVDPAGWQAAQAAVQAARDQLPATPSGVAAAPAGH